MKYQTLPRFLPHSQCLIFFYFYKNEEGNHAENTFVCCSNYYWGIGRSASVAGLLNGGTAMNHKKDALEKLAGVFLTAIAALLCTAIDYLLDQEK